MRKYRVVDLFCGAGGLSLGFVQTNRFEIAGAIDNWDYAIETFQRNHPNIREDAVVVKDASFISSNDFDNTLKRKWELNGRVDVVVGGPPCQGMSLAGKRLSND